jgi:hypothetical protein
MEDGPAGCNGLLPDGIVITGRDWNLLNTGLSTTDFANLVFISPRLVNTPFRPLCFNK